MDNSKNCRKNVYSNSKGEKSNISILREKFLHLIKIKKEGK